MIRVWIALICCLAALSVGCREPQPRIERTTGPPTAQPSVVKSAKEAISHAIASLQVAGIPDPPLRPGVTRTDRERYLLATAKAVEAMRFFENYEGDPEPAGPALMAPNRTEEVAALAPVLAVELADSIDRSDPKRAATALKAALNYADYVARESVAGGVTAGTVADFLTMAVRTTVKQIDPQMNEVLRETLAPFLARNGVGADARKAEAARLRAWVLSMNAEGPPVPVEAILSMLREAGMRKPVPAEVAESLQKFSRRHSPSPNTIPAEVVIAEARMAIDLAISMLDAIDEKLPLPNGSMDVETHPVASLFFARINPLSNQAGDIGKLREEGLRMIELAIRLAQLHELPEKLEQFDENAKSPFNGLLYQYRTVEGGFELARPRGEVANGAIR